MCGKIQLLYNRKKIILDYLSFTIKTFNIIMGNAYA